VSWPPRERDAYKGAPAPFSAGEKLAPSEKKKNPRSRRGKTRPFLWKGGVATLLGGEHVDDGVKRLPKNLLPILKRKGRPFPREVRNIPSPLMKKGSVRESESRELDGG